MKLVNPANKRKYTVIVVGSGLAGASAAATLAELGYNVKCFCFQDQPAPRALDRRPGRHQRRQELPERRRLASGASSTTPSRAATSARARPTSTASPRSASTSSTSASPRACRSPASTAACSPTAPSAAPRCRARSTPAARPASSCCSAPTQALARQIGAGGVKMYPRTEMLDLVVVDGQARGIVVRDLVTGEIDAARGRRRGARHRRLRQRVLSLDQRQGLQRHRDLARLQARRVRSPIPATRRSTRPAFPSSGDYQSKLTLMSRVAAQRRPRLGARRRRATRRAAGRRFPRPSATTTSSASIRASATSSPRDIASRAAKEVCDEGRGVGPGGRGVYLDFADAIKRLGEQTIARAVRQPVRDVRADHRREPVQGADAHLPRRALHDGRPLGGLQPDEHHARACS